MRSGARCRKRRAAAYTGRGAAHSSARRAPRAAAGEHRRGDGRDRIADSDDRNAERRRARPAAARVDSRTLARAAGARRGDRRSGTPGRCAEPARTAGAQFQRAGQPAAVAVAGHGCGGSAADAVAMDRVYLLRTPHRAIKTAHVLVRVHVLVLGSSSFAYVYEYEYVYVTEEMRWKRSNLYASSIASCCRFSMRSRSPLTGWNARGC